MSDAQHTPGPWLASPFSSVVGCVVTAQPDPTRNSVRIAGVGGSGTKESVIANARLIAAAPDLLKALRSIALDADESAIRDSAKEAITKATKP